jgi:hypothetical protein
LRRWLADPITIRRRLQSMPIVLTERLRECQIDAVTKLETSLAADHPRALIQMVTGAGKTYTPCVFSHRLVEHAKVRRAIRRVIEEAGIELVSTKNGKSAAGILYRDTSESAQRPRGRG